MPIRAKDLASPENSHIAVKGSATLGQAFALLDAKLGDLSWHLIVARSDGTWVAMRFRELSLKAADDPSQLDTRLEELEWLFTAREVSQDSMGTGLAEDLAGKSPGELVVVTDHKRRLSGIIYVGAMAAAEREAEAPRTPGEADLTEDVLVSKPRVLNSNFAHLEDPSQMLDADDALSAGTEYDLLVDIGPRWSKAQSIVRGLDLFPEETLPPDQDGYAIQVVFASADFLPELTFTQLWLPRGTGRSFPMTNGVPNEQPGPISIHLRAPDLTDLGEANEFTAVGRLYLLYENNLLQSAVLRAGVASEAGIKLAAPNELAVDFVLTGGFHELSRLDKRNVRLHSKDPESFHPVAANLTMNDDGAGNHRLLISHQENQAGLLTPPRWFQFDALDLESIWDEIRAELQRSSFKHDEDNQIIKEDGEPVSALNENIGKSREEFIKDLRALASLGNKLKNNAFRQLIPEGPVQQIRLGILEALKDPAIIQIARTSPANYVFPWSLIYDIPLPGPKYKICSVVDEQWSAEGIRLPEENGNCPHADKPFHAKDIYCPYGFWGLKHILELPVSNLQEREGELILGEPRSLIFAKGQINMAVGVTHALNLKQRDKHLKRLFQLSETEVKIETLADTREGVRDLLGAEEGHEIVYFLCHGEYDDEQNQPYLGVGTRDEDNNHRIYVTTIGDWLDTGLYIGHPSQGGPLVFINGCGTARLGPREVLNFVGAFSDIGASGVIGSEVGVTLAMAAEIGEYLVDRLYQSISVGQAMHEMRWRLVNKGNLLGLAYTAYCQSDLNILKDPNRA